MRGNLPAVVAPMGWLYGAGMRLREQLYSSGALTSYSVKAPVMCVGNLTLGGTGKTPIVRHLVRALVERGLHPGIVSRGYRREGDLSAVGIVSDGHQVITNAAAAGDEPYLLARSLNVPVAVCSNRVKGANALIESYGCDSIVLDDGFQHMRLQRSVDLVLIDSTQDVGKLRVFPSGPLREGVGALSRATAVLHTRAEDGTFLQQNRAAVSRIDPAIPQFSVQFNLSPTLCSLRGLQSCTDVASLPAEGIGAFAGIGNPQRFFEQVQQLGVRLSATQPLPDHAEYTSSIMASLEKLGKILLTTEKDAVKLEDSWNGAATVYVLMQSVTIEGERELLSLIDERIRRHDA